MAENVLVTRSLTKRYGAATVVDRVDLTIPKGEIYGLVGRNGAGKTTIIRMVCAQTLPSGGELELFGETTPKGLQRARSRTGAMVEIPSFYPYLTARANLEDYRRQRGIAGSHVVEEALEQVNLANTGRKKFKTFSLGMKQRLGLALALMNRPDFLLLDEPINGLDPEGIVEFRNLLLELNRQYQTTILISSHILSELQNLATCYGFIDHGKMLEQLSAVELAEKCRDCLELKVDDAPRAAALLEKELGFRDFEVLPGSVIRLYEGLGEPQKVTTLMIGQGISLYGMEHRGANLEDYFLNLIGGVHHA